MSSLPAMIATRPIYNVPPFVYFLPGPAAGTAATFTPTFQPGGEAAGFCSTFPCHHETAILIVFPCCRRVHESVHCLRRIFCNGPTRRCHLTIDSGVILKTGPFPTH